MEIQWTQGFWFGLKCGLAFGAAAGVCGAMLSLLFKEGVNDIIESDLNSFNPFRGSFRGKRKRALGTPPRP